MTEPNTTLGRYVIQAELGKGGFATVYRALGSTLEREVALNVLQPGWMDDAKAVERFMREARWAAWRPTAGLSRTVCPDSGYNSNIDATHWRTRLP
jgi:serine/threonine protein kinase